MEDPEIRVRRMGPPSGDDRLLLDGRLVPAGVDTIDPIQSGLRVALSDSAGGMVVDATLPGGAYAAATRTGWRFRRGAWLYSDPIGTHGIKRARISPMAGGSMLRVTVKGTNGNYRVSPDSLSLTLTFAIDGLTAGQAGSGEVAFDATRCAFSSGGDELNCR